MRTGTAVFHGEITELREQAPEHGHRIRTDNDRRTLELAEAQEALEVAAASDGGVIARGAQGDVGRCVAAIVTDGLALRTLELSEA
jgi:hypothetical protein